MKPNQEEWKECPTCGGLSKDLTNTEIGQEIKKTIEAEGPKQEEYNMPVRTFDGCLWVRKIDFDFLLTSERAKVMEIEREVEAQKSIQNCVHDQDGACYVEYGDVCYESFNLGLSKAIDIIKKYANK